MRKRVYECRAEYFKGITLSVQAIVQLEDDMTIKEMEKELKENVAEHFSNGKRKFTADEIKIKLLRK